MFKNIWKWIKDQIRTDKFDAQMKNNQNMTLNEFFDKQDNIYKLNPGNDRRSQGQLRRYKKIAETDREKQASTTAELYRFADKVKHN